MTIQLQVTNLSMRFKDRVLFHIPHLSLGPNESVYLKGTNGIGKTTLLKILSGLQAPTTGELNIGKKNWFKRLLGLSGNKNVIYLHQSPYLFDGTVYDNVNYGLKYQSLTARERRANIINALRLVGLETLADEHISVLSGGEKQRVAMARAWILKPSILLMDEPSASLDQESIELLVVLAKDLLKRGSSLVITSHQRNALTDLCRRQWVLSNRKLIDSTPLQLVDEEQQHYAYATAN